MLEVSEGVAAVSVSVHQHRGLGIEDAPANLSQRQRLLDDVAKATQPPRAFRTSSRSLLAHRIGDHNRPVTHEGKRAGHAACPHPTDGHRLAQRPVLLEARGLEVVEHTRQQDAIDPALWRRSDVLRPADLCRLARAVVRS